MRKKWKNSIRNLSNLLISTFLFSAQLLAVDGKMPIDHTEINLSDGRQVRAIRCGVHCHCLVIQRGKEAISKQCYQAEYDRLWDYAFFVPIKKGQFVADLDGDGNFEIGVATWDGGNNITDRYALAFSIKGNRLVYFGKKKFNLEYGEYLYE